MADCGASGTTLDQARRAIMGGSGGDAALKAQRQVEQLLGHTSLAAGNRQTLAQMQPQFLSPAVNNNGDALLAASANPNQIRHPMSRGQHQHNMAQQQHFSNNMNYAMPQNQFMQQQQQQQHAMAAQQQQMMMHHQQQQHHQLLMQQQQLNAQQQQQAAAAAALQNATQTSTAVDAIDAAVEGVNQALDDDDYQDFQQRGATIDELSAAWAEAAQDYTEDVADNGVEHAASGATIEELAAAWAQAQDNQDFDAEVAGVDYYSNNGGELNHAPYRFTNTVQGADVQANDAATNDFIEKGLQHFRDGNLADAIYNFEMELQLNDPDNATAWLMLGRCHAENDQDREAIVCLETAVEKDPYSPEALLALGVSYVNELNHVKALAVLKRWVTSNPKYAGLDLSAGEDVYGEEVEHQNESDFMELQNLLLKALEYDPDPSVWEALGVAANVSRDYETAVEAFQKAIDAAPQDYQLWNKLGATLANSNQSAKALHAYHKAIALKPKYARAWLNMAISHSNLQDFDEAARCYLQTLSLNPSAVHCWSYLRVALTCAERWDLIPFAASQKIEPFAEHFDFLRYN